MHHITYTPHGVCSRQIDIDVEDGIITAPDVKELENED